jgi:hypothetical protein
MAKVRNFPSLTLAEVDAATAVYVVDAPSGGSDGDYKLTHSVLVDAVARDLPDNAANGFLRLDADGKIPAGTDGSGLVNVPGGGPGGSGAVDSVAGKTGAVTLEAADITNFNTAVDARITAGTDGIIDAIDAKTGADRIQASAIREAFGGDDLPTALTALDTRIDAIEALGGADPTFTTISVGNADTTIARDSAGVISVEGSPVVTDDRNDPAYFAARAQATADDGTSGPALAEAVTDAYVAMTQANALAAISRIAQNAEIVLFAAPYVSGVRPGITAGSLLTAGDALAADVYGVTLAPTVDLEQDANSFIVTDGDALADYLSYEDSAALLNRNQSATVTKALSGNTIQFDVLVDGHKIVTSTPTDDVNFAAACWTNITDSTAPVQVGIPFGAAANRTVSVTTPADGLISVGLTGADQTASRTAFFELDRFNGQPRIRYLGESAAVTAADPQFIAHAFAVATEVTPPAHQANDLLIAVTRRISTDSALPDLAAGWTDAGVASDGTNPCMRVATKVATSSSETCTGWTSAAQTHCYVFRKPGSTPTLHGTLTVNKNVFSANATFGALNPGVNSVFLGICALISTDTIVLPAGLTALTPGTHGTAPNHAIIHGYSDVATSWSSIDGVKTGTLGRSQTIVLAVK